MQFPTPASIILGLGLASVASAQLSAPEIVKKIAPGAANCPETVECRTAEQAAPHIAASMETHGIYSVNEMAAVIALMAFESVDFRFKHNVFPGRAGQGTANMQMPNFNLLYAKSIPAVQAKVAQFTTTAGLSDADLNFILAQVQPDEFNFGSGAWFLTTQCDKSVRDALQANIDQGFQAYMGCVGVSVTDERTKYLTRAKEAFGIN